MPTRSDARLRDSENDETSHRIRVAARGEPQSSVMSGSMRANRTLLAPPIRAI